MWPISSTLDFIDYFENNGLGQSVCGPPSCTPAVYPENLSSDIPTDVSVEWAQYAGATGYYMYFGTDNPPTSIENGTDIGNVTTYTPPAELEYETDYFWQVVPYNFAGTANSCEVFQFTSTIHTVELDLKVILEGPYNSGQMTPHLNNLDFLPHAQPYNSMPWLYQGTENIESVPPDVVDWILVDILKPYPIGNDIKFELLNRTAGFILNDGTITDLTGLNNVTMAVDASNSEFHVRIQHRNHLPVVTLNPLSGINGIYVFDFSASVNQLLGGPFAQKEVEPGTWAMIAADGNANLQIDNIDKNDVWVMQEGMKGYHSGDFNMDSEVNESDKIAPLELNLGRGVYPIQDTVPAK